MFKVCSIQRNTETKNMKTQGNSTQTASILENTYYVRMKQATQAVAGIFYKMTLKEQRRDHLVMSLVFVALIMLSLLRKIAPISVIYYVFHCKV